MRVPRSLLLAGMAAAATFAAAVHWGLPRGEDPSGVPITGDPIVAVAAADRFLERYVDPDGRVVRRDQGGDTVSEGQGYALLLAIATDDEAAFRQIWHWTRDHLQRVDGTFSWRWDGDVLDVMPATDADVEIAWALVLASERFEDPDLAREGRRIASAVLTYSTVAHTDGRLLVAGPWAAAEPAIVNPSYHLPAAFADLAAATGDERWQEVSDSGRQLVGSLTGDGRLPPDWAQIARAGDAEPIGPPGASTPARYGLDAARTPIRLAASCDGRDRDLAAALWERIGGLDANGGGIAYTLDGALAEGATSPVGLMAAAASAASARDEPRARARLADAIESSERSPTYFGDAWVALGIVLLTTDVLVDCAGTAGG